MENIGLLGLGIMGTAMGNTILAHEYPLVVFNRTPEKVAPFLAAGVKVAATPAELARDSEVVITMLSDAPAVLSVLNGLNGALTELKPGKTVINMSTVSPEQSSEIAYLVQKTGAEFIEAPVLGSKGPASNGTLVILAGGNRETVSRLEPLLLTVGSRVFYLGEIGLAAQMKLIVNQVLGTLLGVLAEAGLTGMAAGLPAEQILEVLASSVVGCPAVAVKGKEMLIDQRFEPNFPLKHAHKDLRLAVLAGDALNVPTPVTAAAYQLLSQARRKGFGDRDVAAVVRGLTEP